MILREKKSGLWSNKLGAVAGCQDGMEINDTIDWGGLCLLRTPVCRLQRLGQSLRSTRREINPPWDLRDKPFNGTGEERHRNVGRLETVNGMRRVSFFFPHFDFTPSYHGQGEYGVIAFLANLGHEAASCRAPGPGVVRTGVLVVVVVVVRACLRLYYYCHNNG